MCCSSVTHLCPILCNLMDCSMPGFPVLHYLQEFAQTHVHGVQEFAQTHVHGWMVDSIQPSHPLFSVAPFFSCPQCFPASESFPMSQLFASGGQHIGGLDSAPVLPMNIQGWFPLGLTGLISLLSKGLFNSLLQHHNSKALILQCSAFFMPTLTSVHDYWKNHSFNYTDLYQQVMSLLFNMQD